MNEPKPDPVAALISVRDELRRELREKLPSPAQARKIAIATGAHTLDRTGKYEPPCTREQEAEARRRGHLMYPLVEFLELHAQVTPDQAAAWIDREWLNDEVVAVSARRAAEWLVRFADAHAAMRRP